MADETYLEIVDARTDDIRRTGIGAVFDTEEEARQAFEAARALEVVGGGFLLDLYVNGDLVDTIELDAAGVQAISGEKPRSPEYYTEYDRQYWASLGAVSG